MNNSKTFLNLNLLKQKKFNFNKPGKYIVFFHNLSGELIFNINAKGGDLDIYGLYTGKDQDKFIVKTQQRHVAPSARSNLLIKGVFDDTSSFHYEGLIKIEKKAQQSHAYQKNQNIILADGVFIRSEPFLEILANEFFSNHEVLKKPMPEKYFSRDFWMKFTINSWMKKFKL